VGVLPALLVFWIRRAVPESDEWQSAKTAAAGQQTRISDLFSPGIWRTTAIVIIVCGLSLTGHWAFMFWHQQHLRNLPGVIELADQEKNRIASLALYLVIGSSILGNFFAGWVARFIGYRKTIILMFAGYFAAVFGAYFVARDYHALLFWFVLIGFAQGAFALFTMYLPPLFPTLLRTTGAGFSYNIGRIIAAFGTVFFGLFSKVGDHRAALFYAGFLFVPAALMAAFLPKCEESDILERTP